MSFFKKTNFFKIVNKKLLGFGILVAISLCVFQIDNIATTLTNPTQSVAISETHLPVHDSHIPQVCSLSNQKYSNQIKSITDLLASNNQEFFNFSKSLRIVLSPSRFEHIQNNKIYIKNVTLLV